MRISTFIITCMVLLAFGLALYAYPHLPDRIDSHWNAQGQANGTMPRWSVFFFPSIMAFWGVLFLAIPFLDPLKICVFH